MSTFIFIITPTVFISSKVSVFIRNAVVLLCHHLQLCTFHVITKIFVSPWLIVLTNCFSRCNVYLTNIFHLTAVFEYGYISLYVNSQIICFSVKSVASVAPTFSFQCFHFSSYTSHML